MRSKLRRAIAVALPDPGYYGWWVVGACMLCAGLSAPGQSYALALYMEPISADLGVSRVEVASSYAWATLAAAALLPWAGRLADRSSSRVFLSAVVASLGLALLLLSAVDSGLSLLAAFVVLRLLGQGATGLGVLTTVLRWFDRYRGRAVAIAVTGYAVGEFVMPGVIVRLQADLGWRGSLVALACAYLFVLAPLIYRVVRAPAAHDRARAAGECRALPERSVTAARAIRMPRFWLLVSVVSVTPFVLTALMFNHVALFHSIGWSALDVARALQGYAITGVVATYATGALLDRVPVKFGAFVAMTLLTAALLVPLGVRSPVLGVLAYGALLGAAAGSIAATNGILWPAYFGVASVGAIKGVVTTVRNGATAAAAPLGAWMVDRGDGFDGVLMAGAVLAAATAGVALFLPAAPDSATDESLPAGSQPPDPALADDS